MGAKTCTARLMGEGGGRWVIGNRTAQHGVVYKSAEREERHK